jgi:hypothetical protein
VRVVPVLRKWLVPGLDCAASPHHFGEEFAPTSRVENIAGETTMTVAEKNRSESRPFEADVAKLLQLIVHSVYSEKSVFLRELISNAADACGDCATRRSLSPRS